MLKTYKTARISRCLGGDLISFANVYDEEGLVRDIWEEVIRGEYPGWNLLFVYEDRCVFTTKLK